MKLSKIKIDDLFLFYILSLALLGLSWQYGLIELKETSGISNKVALELDHAHRFNVQKKAIEVLDPEHHIYYSTDGGNTFIESGTSVSIEGVVAKDITSVPTSIRWLPPLDQGPQLKSCKFFVSDDEKKIRSEAGVFTDFSLLKTDLPVVHLSINEDDLFDEFSGIFVQGAASWKNQDFQEAWWYRDANYTQRGMDWEKQVHFEYFKKETDGDLYFSQKCGLRISGNATRGFPQKSFRLASRELYGADKFDFGFFGKEGNKKYESVVLRMSGNDNTNTMFADLLIHDLVSGSNVLTQKGQPVLLFINGNYWGIYNLRERIDAYYVAKYNDCKKKDITILEDGSALLKDGSEAERERFLNLVEEVRKMDVVSAKDYSRIGASIDLDSYMDYIFFETYFANNDWPENNAHCYKVKGQKWKWILNDVDYSLAYPGSNNVHLDMFGKIRSSNSVHAVFFNKLLTNPDFKKAFKSLCRKNMNSYLSESRITGKFNFWIKKYEPEMDQQIKRWRNISSMDEWEKNCQNNLNFLLKRKEIYNKQLDGL